MCNQVVELRRLLSATVVVAFVLANGVGARVFAQQTAPQRDVGGQQAAPMRAIPVGNASISGAVTSADGRPIRNVRVTLNGGATIPEGAMPTSRENVTVVSGGGPMVITGGGGLGLSRSVTTDATGRYAFEKLPAGHFTLNFAKTNFITANYGEKRPGGPGRTIFIADGQQLTVDIAMHRGGVITGTVFGIDGDPSWRTQVGVWRVSMVGGRRSVSMQSSVQTDDRGQYRLPGLQPGDYVIGAWPNPGELQDAARRVSSPESEIEQAIASGKVQPPSAPGFPSTVLVPGPLNGPRPPVQIPDYLPTFSPGTPVADLAQVIHVTGDDEQVVDITVQLIEGGSIEGTVSPLPKAGLSVRVYVRVDDGSATAYRVGSVDASGRFTITALAPGQYSMMAQTVASPNTTPRGTSGPPPDLAPQDQLWGTLAVSVQGGYATPVTLPLRPARSISGTMVFDTSRPFDPTRSRLMVSLTNAGPNAMPGGNRQSQIEPDGRFTIRGVPAGTYSLRVNTGGLGMKSAMIGGVDALDFPFEFDGADDVTGVVLTMTDKLSELSGAVTEPTGKPGVDYTLVVASTDERFWSPTFTRRILVGRTTADGKYTFRGIPPGDYHVVVLSDLEPSGQYDPDFLRSLVAIGTRVRISEGAKTVQDLRVK
jgi:protocatechuate 3,4-dioxygenase beta subunit